LPWAIAAAQIASASDGNKDTNLKRPQRPVWICGTGRNARYWHDALVSNAARIEGFVDLDRPNARQSKRHRPVITYQALWERLQMPTAQMKHEAPFIISAISEPKARDTLREQFELHGLRCYSDFAMG